MMSYGWSKLTLYQFAAHGASILDEPFKDIDNFSMKSEDIFKPLYFRLLSHLHFFLADL